MSENPTDREPEVIDQRRGNLGRLSHGHRSDRRRSSTHKSWQSMKSRCCNPRDVGFKNYGARGITVCDRWMNSFENFLADMGERPEGLSLDRKDVNLGYDPDNCRWATRSEQARNTGGRRRKLSNEDIAAVVSMYADQQGVMKIARQFEVSDMLIRAILKGRGPYSGDRVSAYRPTTADTLVHDLERFADFVATRLHPTDDETRVELAKWLNKKLDSLLASDAFGTEGQSDPRGDHRR